MAKADMHVHSRFSEHPTDWFLKRIGANESYTDPKEIYRLAKERGMDLVTITDHNRFDGAEALVAMHPKDCFTGLEATSYFPEDGCKIHLLVYGLKRRQFMEIDRLRHDIYQLRNYLLDQGLLHAVAHPTYSVNGKLTVDHLEKLLLMFDIFEGRNGGRNRSSNDAWIEVVRSLTREQIEQMNRRHGIEPRGQRPWRKALIAGSDDHAGMFIGETFTEAGALDQDDFIARLREGNCSIEGRNSDYYSLAFTVYKVAYDFSKQRKNGDGGILGIITEKALSGKQIGLGDRFKLWLAASTAFGEERALRVSFAQLIEEIESSRSLPGRLPRIYDRICGLTDEFLKLLLQSLEHDFMNGNFEKIIKNLSASLPGIFLSLPFFTTMGFMNDNRNLLKELSKRFPTHQGRQRRKILWFSDTYNDLNGVSVTLKALNDKAMKSECLLGLALLENTEKASSDSPSNSLMLPAIYRFKLPGYEYYTLGIPSPLTALKMIHQFEPDEIYLSTPGPMGIMGLLASKLLKVPCTAVYHTDFSLQARDLVNDDAVCELLEKYSQWFHQSADRVAVPTRQYIEILESRGMDRRKMTIFHRGVDTDRFRPRAGDLRTGQGDSRRMMIYTGRISEDKNLDFLLRVYRRLIPRIPGLQLMVCGDGPYLRALKEKNTDLSGVTFTGALENSTLPEMLGQAALMVVPSTTDTFGMAVAEAQSCGLPAVVSDIGGPSEIVVHGVTGMVVKANDEEAWIEALAKMIDLAEACPGQYAEMRQAARENIMANWNWDRALESIFGCVSERITAEVESPSCLVTV
jgi:glycosyltransferase involved in cell wall biosynthesis